MHHPSLADKHAYPKQFDYIVLSFSKSCHIIKSLTVTMSDISDESTSKKPKKPKTKTR